MSQEAATAETMEPTNISVSDSTEVQLGISVYLSPDHEGFSGVLKARYSDFVVHEVGRDGRLAQLESTDPKDIKTDSNGGTLVDKDTEEDTSRKRKRENNNKTTDTEDVTAKQEPLWKELEGQLKGFVGIHAAQPVIEYLQKESVSTTLAVGDGEQVGMEANNQVKMFAALPPIEDKSTRREVHQWIRSSLDSVARADTADDDNGNKVIRLWPLKYESKMPNYGKFDRDGRRVHQSKSNKTENRPSGFLQFVLYKENCDTNYAIKQLTRRLARGGKNNKIRVGYAGMKDKRGITSQFCTLYQRSPSEISWINNSSTDSSHGGGNSSKGGVSIVRVGNFQYVSEEIRLGTLQGNRFDVALRNIKTNKEHDLGSAKQVLANAAEALRQNGFINYFGTQRFGKFHDTHLCGMAFLQGDFEKICSLILRPKEGEQQHVYDARAKWQNRFCELPIEAPAEARAKAESDCAKAILRSFGHFMANEVSILESLSRKPLDYKRAFSCINKTMRMMFMHAAQSLLWNQVASHRIEKFGRNIIEGDLVYEDRNSDDLGTNKPSIKAVTTEDIAANHYQLDDVILPLLGTKSLYPKNESGQLFEELLKQNSLSVDMFKKVQDRDISCPGDYRQLICRPGDVDFTILEYKDPSQPLLQTDLMKLTGVDIQRNIADIDGQDQKPLLGMVVGFTLPSSAYATIALRELMKRPTSSEYQKELELSSPVIAEA